MLQVEAERLKKKYGKQYQRLIDENYRWVEKYMQNSSGSVSVQEGQIALSFGLPLGKTPKPKLGSRSKSFRKR